MENNEQHITDTLENSINQGLQEAQKMVGDTKEKVGNISNFTSVLNKNFEMDSKNNPIVTTLQPITHTIQIISSKLEKALEITEITLEYINTGDSITIVGKVAGNTINTWIVTEGMYLSKVIAQEVVNIGIRGKTPVGIIVFSAGSIISFFFADKAEEIFKDLYFNKGHNTFKPLDEFLEKYNFPAKPTCPKESKMPDGRCAPSVQELWQDIFLLSSTYPKLSPSYKEALARIKELEPKFKLASSNHIQSDAQIDYFSQDDMQEYYEKQMIIASEERKYKTELENYEKELEYKSNTISYCLEQLNKIILPQITQNKDLQYNETLGILSQNNYKIKILDEKDIDSINMDSGFAYFRALFLCENIIVTDEQGNPALNDSNFFKYFNYKSSFYISFIANKNSLSENYLNARKALYKSMMKLREERQEHYKKEQNRISQLSYEEYTQEKREQERILREKQRQSRLFNKNMSNKDSKLILVSKDKSNVIIFLDSDNSLSNLIHIHNSKIDIFTKDKSTIDIQELINNYKEYGITLESLNSANTQIFLYSQLLIGSKETLDNPLYFGELDSKGVDSKGELDETKPIYYLETNDEFDIESNSKDSNTYQNNTNSSRTNTNRVGTSTLQVFLNDSSLTLLNYSILDSSLNIKLECKSKESKAIQEREQAQRDCHDFLQKSRNDDMISTAMLHPVLEDNEIKCPHGGVVKLKSNKGKSFKSKDVPMILESDLLNSQIIGCTNNILGVPTPCTQVSVILPSARGLKKYNDDYPIMQDLVSSGCLSDKGFPLIATPKPNTFKINSPSPSSAKEVNKESIKSNIDTSIPLCKIITSFKDLDEFYLTPTYYENRDSKDRLISSQSNFYNTYKQIDIELDSIVKDTNTLDSSNIESNQCLKDILDSILLDYSKEYFSFRIFSIRVAYSIYEYLLIIPKSIPSFIAKLLKEKRDKEELKYGYGNFMDLHRDYVI